MKWMGIAAAAGLLATGCKPAGAEMVTAKAAATKGELATALAALKAVPVDSSTPDRTLKTLWALQDAQAAVDCAAAKEAASATDELSKALANYISSTPARPELFGGSIAKWQAANFYGPCQAKKFEREINEIKTETDSRAIAAVTIRNVAPIPEGSEPSNWDKTDREKGMRYRYVFTKVETGWRLEEVYKASSLLEQEYRIAGDLKPPYPSETAPF